MQNTGQILKEPKGLQPPLEGGRRGPNLCQQPRLSTGKVEQALSLRSGLLRKAEMDFSEQWTGIWLILCFLHLLFSLAPPGGGISSCVWVSRKKTGLLLSEVSFSCARTCAGTGVST